METQIKNINSAKLDDHTSSKKWLVDGANWNLGNIPSVVKKLDSGVYELCLSKAGFYLEKRHDKFPLPEKIFNSEKRIISQVIKSFKTNKNNLGVLFQGLRGTGKTITAKLICNMLDLPVIIVTNTNGPDFSSFICDIDQDVILFFDEFEKMYNVYREDDEGENDNKPGIYRLLTIMDGVMSSKFKRLFLLTTNEVRLPRSMTSRPSRIRYIKSFQDLDQETILEILVSEIVPDKHIVIPEVIKYLGKLDIITVDLVKEIAKEINIFWEPGDVVTDTLFYFNAEKSNRKNYSCTLIIKDKKDNVISTEEVYGVGGFDIEDWLDLYQDNDSRSEWMSNRFIPGYTCESVVKNDDGTYSVIFNRYVKTPNNKDYPERIEYKIVQIESIHKSLKHVY